MPKNKIRTRRKSIELSISLGKENERGRCDVMFHFFDRSMQVKASCRLDRTTPIQKRKYDDFPIVCTVKS